MHNVTASETRVVDTLKFRPKVLISSRFINKSLKHPLSFNLSNFFQHNHLRQMEEPNTPSGVCEAILNTVKNVNVRSLL
jgi:hypothetical protein